MYPEKQEVYFFYFDVHTPQYPDDVLFFMLTKYLLNAYVYLWVTKDYEYLWATE